MQVTILGNGAGGPFQGRHYTAQVLRIENQTFLIDCGEGTQMQLYQHRVRHDRIRQIFISHLHGDHVFGLIGLLTSFCLKQRSAKLEVFSPPGLQELVETSSRLCGIRYPYPLVFQEVDAAVSAKIFENKAVEVWTVPLHHRTACTGWLFREKPHLRNIRKEKIEEYAIPYQSIPGIKAGGGYVLPDGREVSNDELTTPPRRPYAYAFCSDTTPSDVVVEAVRGVDLLYHEATFTEEHREEAAISFHSTAAQAADIARRAGVGKLLLGHFSARYKNEEQHLAEARMLFPETYATVEGMTYPS